MNIHLHNTLTRKKEEFIPIDEKNVRMYVCGPTVYDKAHLGNARPPIVFDVLYRLLKHVYGENHVTYASNITDVDDKILNKHKQTGKPIREITEQTLAWYLEDMKKLNVLEPNFRPRATDFIPEMIDMVKKLIENGNAYISEGHVLFDVDSMPDYGKLSGRSMKEMIAGARVEVADYKKNPADFILWKPSDADQPGWDSPWGYGRPGWHLECSAMSSKHLGNSFDIHGGGSDLIFPHHENEVAQSCCAYPNDTYAKYWVHNGMLNVDGVKMSKSLGNFYTLDEILEKYPAEALRLFFLSTHYHQPFNFTLEGLQKAKETLDKFYTSLRGIPPLNFKGRLGGDYNPSKRASASAKKDDRIINALADDLNTPLALTYIHEMVGDLNKAQTEEEKLQRAGILLASAEMLGLLYNDPEAWFKGDIDDSEIAKKIEERAEAKKNKDFAKADQIRNELLSQGIALEDTPQGTNWKKI